MRLSLHRTIPFIAVAALVTVSSAGAQEREDSTSTVGGVVSLMGLGARFVVLSGGSDEASRPNEWNCAGGCRAFGARSLGVAPFGDMPSARRSSSKASSIADARAARSLADRADLSDYGWSRRVNTDGSPVAPAPVAPVFASTEDAPSGSNTDRREPAVAAPAPDGAGQAPAWTAPGSGPSALNIPIQPLSSWTNEAGDDQANGAGASDMPAQSAATQAPVVSRVAESMDQVAPLVTTVPEPGTVVLLAIGLASLVAVRRRSTRAR